MMANPYRHLQGKSVTVKFDDNGGEFTAKGKLSCEGYNAMVQVGGWMIGIANIREITEDPSPQGGAQ